MCEIIGLFASVVYSFSLYEENNLFDLIPLSYLEEYIPHFQPLMYSNQQCRPHHHPTNQEIEYELSSKC